RLRRRGRRRRSVSAGRGPSWEGGVLPDHDAVEWIAASGSQPAVVLTCEHASERLPSPYAWPTGDARLVGTHWAFDLGIAPFARALAAELGAPAVLSRFSRLLVDPNRPLDAPTLF